MLPSRSARLPIRSWAGGATFYRSPGPECRTLRAARDAACGLHVARPARCPQATTAAHRGLGHRPPGSALRALPPGDANSVRTEFIEREASGKGQRHAVAALASLRLQALAPLSCAPIRRAADLSRVLPTGHR